MEPTNTRSDLVSELLIFRKWRDSASPIKFMLTSAGTALSAQGWAVVARADSGEIGLDIRDGAGFITLNPSLCSFRYQDSREAQSSNAEDVASKVVCAISVSTASGIDLFLYEWKSEPEEES